MSSKSDGTNPAPAVSQANAQTSPGTKTTSTTHWYTSEIQQMMHGFGDCRKPLLDSAVLIEDIVKQQMTSLLHQTSDIASMRGSRFIGLEDLLFLLRKDKVKLRRLLRYLQIKDEKSQVLKNTGVDEVEDTGEGTPGTWGQSSWATDKRRRLKQCHDFLSTIDGTGELVALLEDQGVDEVKQERLLRAELQSRNMDANQYMEFSNARRVSLGKRYRSQRFREWLLHGVNVDIKPSQQSIEIFSYMAYETIAQIVDFALIVKQDLRAISGDVMTKALPPVTTNIQDMSVINPTSITSSKPSPGLTSPSQSPPTTPTSAGLSSSTGSLGGNSGASTSSKNKAKKRKKSSYGSSIDMITSQAIQPQEIHEAIRRYSQMIGPFSSVVRTNPYHSPKMNLACC